MPGRPTIDTTPTITPPMARIASPMMPALTQYEPASAPNQPWSTPATASPPRAEYAVTAVTRRQTPTTVTEIAMPPIIPPMTSGNVTAPRMAPRGSPGQERGDARSR